MSEDALLAHLAILGQKHLLAGFDSLSSEKKLTFSLQLKKFDAKLLQKQRNLLLQNKIIAEGFKPLEKYENAGNADNIRIGEALIASGKVGCIILAGGQGTRLRSVVADVPKPLAKIGETPFLALLLRQLSAVSYIDKVILAIGYKGDLIQDYFLRRPSSIPLEYSIEREPLGTGGALKQALSLCSSSDVCVLNGDSFLDLDFDLFWKRHVEMKADLTLAAIEVAATDRFGTLGLDPTLRVLTFGEKQGRSRGWINGGIYLMKSDLLVDFPSVFSLENEGFPKLLEQRVFGFQANGSFIDIGTPESYVEAQNLDFVSFL